LAIASQLRAVRYLKQITALQSVDNFIIRKPRPRLQMEHEFLWLMLEEFFSSCSHEQEHLCRKSKLTSLKRDERLLLHPKAKPQQFLG